MNLRNASINDEHMEQGNEFIYPEYMISKNGRMNGEIENRRTAGQKVFGALVMYARNMNVSRKARLSDYKRILEPYLTY